MKRANSGTASDDADLKLPQVFTYSVSNQALHITYHEDALLTTFLTNPADLQHKLQLKLLHVI